MCQYRVEVHTVNGLNKSMLLLKYIREQLGNSCQVPWTGRQVGEGMCKYNGLWIRQCLYDEINMKT